MAPSDFHLFTYLKQFRGSTYIGSDEEVKKIVTECFTGLVANVYAAGILKLITQLEKCLNLQRDNVET
jgi:hypothetical protein